MAPPPPTPTRTQGIGEAAFGVEFDTSAARDAAGRPRENAIVGAAKYVLENTARGEREREFV